MVSALFKWLGFLLIPCTFVFTFTVAPKLLKQTVVTANSPDGSYQLKVVNHERFLKGRSTFEPIKLTIDLVDLHDHKILVHSDFTLPSSQHLGSPLAMWSPDSSHVYLTGMNHPSLKITVPQSQ